MKMFDGFTTFLLKCGIIPPWEVKLRAYEIANRVYETGGAPKYPVLPTDDRERWVERNWHNYSKMAKSMIAVHRPRW